VVESELHIWGRTLTKTFCPDKKISRHCRRGPVM
jgi:hypothetical protein